MSVPQEVSVFLGTTAARDFWETDRPLVLAGPWCLPQGEETKPLPDHSMLPNPWGDRTSRQERFLYIDQTSEYILEQLADYLNTMHGVAYDLRYWRVLLGSWLMYFGGAVYDRYLHVQKAFELYPGFQTWLLDPKDYQGPYDTLEMLDHLEADDLFNLQLFSEIFQAMGHHFPVRTRSELPSQPTPPSLVRRSVTAARNLLNHAISNLEGVVRRLASGRWSVGLCATTLRRRETWPLAWRSGFRLMPVVFREGWSMTRSAVSFDARRQKLAELRARDPFEKVFMSLLPHHLPTLVLEDYSSAVGEVSRLYPHYPAAILSSVGWYFHDPFKFWAALASKKGIRLWTEQHGGTYGLFRFNAYELLESRIGDTYWVWGWADKNLPMTRNLPSSKLAIHTGRPRTNSSPQPPWVLFIASAQPRYTHALQSFPLGDEWDDYYDQEIKFLQVLPLQFRRRILFRVYFHHYGQFMRARLSGRFPEVRIDADRPFDESLSDTRLAIIDHCGTSLLQTLSANIPTILYWNVEYWPLADDAQPYLDGLRKVGIWWGTPDEAAAKATSVYDDPWAWWGKPEVQEERKRFANRFAFTPTNWIDDWGRILNQEAERS